MRIAYLSALVLFTLPNFVFAQSEIAARPTVGLRDDRPGDHALVHADVVVQPGQTLSDVTILVEGTAITAVGKEIEIPPGYETIDCQDKRIYAGLIDAWSEVEVPLEQSKSAYWNQNVTPQSNAAQAAIALPSASKLRSQGITTRLVAPSGGIVKGTSSVVLLDDASDGRTLLRKRAWQHLQLSVPRSGPRENYPNSPMGATALLRQAIYDAKWYREAWDAYRANPALPRPETNLALQELSQSVLDDTCLIDAPNERMAIRADAIAKEFSLKVILRGSGREYRDLPSIVAANHPILLPVDFPEAPNVKSAQALQQVTLQELMHWDLAPANPARVHDAGVAICLTTDGLDDVGQYLKQVRKAVQRGLPRDAALAAMTTVPAELLGIEEHVGRVQPGQLANLVITDGDLFADETKVVECWVAGKRFELESPPNDAVTNMMVGTWSMQFLNGDQPVSLQLVLSEKNDKLEGVVKNPSTPENEKGSIGEKSETSNDESKAAEKDAEKATDAQDEARDDKGEGEGDDDEGDDDEGDDDKEKARPSKLKNLVRERDRMVATLDLHEADASLEEGISLLTLITVKADESNERPNVFATITLPGGETSAIELRFIESPQDSETDQDQSDKEKESTDASLDKEEGAEAETDEEAVREAKEADEEKAFADAETPVLLPLGAYGLESPIVDQPTVLLRGATLWTCDEAGVLESADLLLRDGVIVAVGKELEPPSDCEIIELQGKHITPG